MKRKCLESIAGKNGRSFVESNVTGGPSATEVVVIHCRQVVVDERIRMDHLEGARGLQQQLFCCPKHLSSSNQECRAKTLATGKYTPANCLMNLFGRRVCKRQQPI